MDYRTTVKDFLVENFLFGDDIDLDDDTSLLEARILDSTGVLELVSFIEQIYDIQVDDEEIIPENLDTLQNIVNYLTRKINGVRSAL